MANSGDDNEGNEIKAILIGNCGVGKTNIILRYLKNEFNTNSLSTNGANYGMKKLTIDGVQYQINLWDTAGQEKYRAVTKMFLQDTNIIVLVYSIDDKGSFDDLDYWYNLTKDIIKEEQIVLGVAANKSDLFEKEVVNEEAGRQFAENHKAIFQLMSAKEGKEPIDMFFDSLLREYIKIKDNAIKNSSLKIDGKGKKKSGKCCGSGKVEN